MFLALVPLWEFLVWLTGWLIANKFRILAFATIADAVADGGLAEVWRRGRLALAAVANMLSSLHFDESDFRSTDAFIIGLTREVSTKTGIPIRNVLDRDMLREDLENHALNMIEQRTGIRLSSLTDVQALKNDFVRIAGGVIVERTGIPLSDITDPDQVKADVLAWAKDLAMAELGEDVGAAVAAQVKTGVSLMQVVRERVGKNVGPRTLLSGIHDAAVKRYMIQVQDPPGGARGEMTKAEWRRYCNKIAQRRFRARSDRKNAMWDGRTGGKMAYVPKNWNVVITPPSTPSKRLGRGKSAGLKR